MPLQLEDLGALDAPAGASGAPRLLALDLIDEDPEQPRQEFDEASLQALSETIRQRGVRQPVSVRSHPTQPGRWMLNFGARRLRACRLAGLGEIPAFVDPTADSYDQVIENEQREGLRPLELALFVQKRLRLREKQVDIARRMGKSPQWLTLVTAMIDPPDWLLQIYRDGRCRGLNELYELRRLQARHGEQVVVWADGPAVITRERLAVLKAELEGRGDEVPHAPTSRPAEQAPASESRKAVDGGASPVAAQASPPTAASKPAAARSSPTRAVLDVHVLFEGQAHQLVLSVAPEQAASMYVVPMAGGARRLAPVADLTLLGFSTE